MFPCHAIKHKVVFNSATDDVVTYKTQSGSGVCQLQLTRNSPEEQTELKHLVELIIGCLSICSFLGSKFQVGRRQGRQKKKWEDIREWTGLEFAKSQRAVENGENWL